MNEIIIEPVTRIEGHAKITVFLDEAGEVKDAHFHVTQFRGFERIAQGRPVHEMPSLMARICGICPVSHLIASAKACDENPWCIGPPCGGQAAPGHEPGSDSTVARSQLFPPLVTRFVIGLRPRTDGPQHRGRGGAGTRAGERRHRRS